MVKFRLSTAEFTASTETDEPIHPDLLDEMARRCVRLFVEGFASLPDVERDDDG